jgi:hypothetical protein
MSKKTLSQVLCIMGWIAAAAHESVKRWPIGLAKLRQRRARCFRVRLTLSGRQNNAPLSRDKRIALTANGRRQSLHGNRCNKTAEKGKPRKNDKLLQRRFGNPFGKGKRSSLPINQNAVPRKNPMKTQLKTMFALLTFLAVFGVLAAPANAQNSPVTMQITGGSTGKFLSTPHSINTTGYSDFAVNVKVRQDGTASGQFVCAVLNAIVISGQVTNATVNADGSVTVTGLGYGYIVGVGGFENDSFFATFRPGGPQVGGFDFADANFPAGFYDTEAVRYGSINFQP